MKKISKMKKQFFTLLLISLSVFSYSQSALDLDMLFNPDANKVLINGLGGSNFGEVSRLKQMNNAAKFDFMYNHVSGSDKFTNFSLKFSPMFWNKFDAGDSFLFKDLYFNENKSAFFFGINRFNTTKIGANGYSQGDVPNNQRFWSYFGNLSYTQYSINSTIPENNGFDILQTELGGQFGYLFETDVANFMFNFSAYATYFHVLDNSTGDRAFEEMFNSQETLSGDYAGFGGKILFQLNNYAIHFEGKYYQSVGNYAEPSDFAPFSVSIGATVQGSILKFGNSN